MRRCVMGRMASRTVCLITVLLLMAIPSFLLINHSDHATSIKGLFSGAVYQEDLSYGVIMDAGSTGTRLFLYCWSSKSDEELIDINPTVDENGNQVMQKVLPGLSSFADKPTEAADYIVPLLKYAMEYIPEEKRPYTPVFLFATAGMRLVPIEKQQAILSNLHSQLPQLTPMQIMKEHIRVIEGKWEGIYSWIAVNYILGKFNQSSNEMENGTMVTAPTSRQKTVGMIDMGGASMQIAFEMGRNETFLSTNVENVNLGCQDDSDRFKYKLFVTTFLGYGVNEGLRKYEQSLSDQVVARNWSYVRDSCMPTNLAKTVNRDDGTKFVRKGTGNWTSCVSNISKLLSPTSSSQLCSPQCFLGNVAAPKISLSDMELYGFSEYWYSTDQVYDLGGRWDYEHVKKKANSFCSQRWSAIQMSARQKKWPKSDDERLRAQCFKSAWVSAILHSGFSVRKEKNKFQSAFTIAGQEVQWALGAMIYHMRYFPLRDSQKNLIINRHPAAELTTSFSPLHALWIVGTVAGIVYILAKKKERKGLRRDPSLWSYMMLASEETINTFRAPSFA